MTDVDRKTKNIVVRCLRPYKGYGLPRERVPSLLLLFFVPSCFCTLAAFVGVGQSLPSFPLPFNSTILLLCALVTLAIFRTQLFLHTCSLCWCRSVIAKFSVPYRHAGVTQVLMTLCFSFFGICRSAITP